MLRPRSVRDFGVSSNCSSSWRWVDPLRISKLSCKFWWNFVPLFTAMCWFQCDFNVILMWFQCNQGGHHLAWSGESNSRPNTRLWSIQFAMFSSTNSCASAQHASLHSCNCCLKEFLGFVHKFSSILMMRWYLMSRIRFKEDSKHLAPITKSANLQSTGCASKRAGSWA